MASHSDTPHPLPSWLMQVGSLVVSAHLLTLLIHVIATESGPWPTDMHPSGRSNVTPPQFAAVISEAITPHYLVPLKMSHTYHFASNSPGWMSAYFEVRLKDDKGKVFKTIRVPNESDQANWWVRHRQSLLAQWLTMDEIVPPQTTEKVAAPGQDLPTTAVWLTLAEAKRSKANKRKDFPEAAPGKNILILHPEYIIKLRDLRGQRAREGGNPDIQSPSTFSMILARAYVRYLCRKHGADSGELVRYTRRSVRPELLVLEGNLQVNPEIRPVVEALRQNTFEELVSYYGELPK